MILGWQLKIGFRVQVVIAFLLTAALTGVIGNRTDDFVVKVLPEFLSRPVTTNVGWILFSVLWMVGLPLVISVRYKAALRDVSNLNKIGDRLASNILSLYTPIPNRVTAEKNARKVVRTLFQDIIEKNGPFETCGIAIYRPNSAQDCLNAWIWYSTPNHASDSVAFYIGNDAGRNNPSSARGVAGTTFMDGKTRVVHFDRYGRADTNLYLPYSNGRTSYRSFISTAISSSVETQKGFASRRLGVLCLYSSGSETFDNEGIKTNVESLAYRFSLVLMSFAQ